MNDDEIAALYAYKYRVNDVGALQEYDEYEVGYAEERVWVTGSEVLNAINTLSRAGHRSRLICYIELLRVHHNVLYTKKTDARHLLFGKNRCFKLRTCKLCERVPQCIYCYVHKKNVSNNYYYVIRALLLLYRQCREYLSVLNGISVVKVAFRMYLPISRPSTTSP